MFVKFITSRLLRVIVCAAAGLYGLYNAISCFVTLLGKIKPHYVDMLDRYGIAWEDGGHTEELAKFRLISTGSAFFAK